MNRNISLLAFFTIVYCFVYFVLSSIVYFISLSQGYGGLALPLFGGGDDGKRYAQEAINVAKDLPATLTSIHALVLGYVLKIFHSENLFLLKAFNYLGNVLLALVSLVILKRTVKAPKVYNVSAFVLLLLLICYPSLLLNSSMSIIRDAWICLYYLLAILFFSNIFMKGNHKSILLNIVFLIIVVYLLFGYREYALLSCIMGSLLYLFFLKSKKPKRSNKKIILFSLILFAIVYTSLRSYTIPIVNMSLQDALMYRQSGIELFTGGSQMNISLDQSNVVLFLINYVYSIISNAFGPFPWQITGVSTLLIFLTESLFFSFVFIFLYKRKHIFSKMDLLLITHSIVWFMLIGITNDNIGTAARLRMVGWIPALIVFAKYFGLYLISKRTEKKVNEEKESGIL
ncbi:hypothetical protein BAOM_4755 [Peribacillus asahii]|uniref:Glycosyltransferase RgtA/B/C/D-like domain-containing protein n=1 Tax=Peribacillus asahii TaxID=228899 RepID=A0A3T0KYH4_9BACI|nr:hypothetical protein [Peribacillus asahii]AZV45333.1 hypothetical protein BAOM_4755 [Peribacillus asahii]